VAFVNLEFVFWVFVVFVILEFLFCVLIFLMFMRICCLSLLFVCDSLCPKPTSKEIFYKDESGFNGNLEQKIISEDNNRMLRF
jgi:hypothetical protein